MKIMGDFMKVILWIGLLALLRFLIEYWVSTQNYTLYSILSGLSFFILVAYISYKEIKI